MNQPTPRAMRQCDCRIVRTHPDADTQYEMGLRAEQRRIRYCPLHASAPELLQFIKDIRPFLGYDPEATLHKRADKLITASRGSK